MMTQRDRLAAAKPGEIIIYATGFLAPDIQAACGGDNRCQCEICCEIEAAYFANRARLAGLPFEQAEAFLLNKSNGGHAQ